MSHHHLTELFNGRGYSNNRSAELGTSLYLILSQEPLWQRGAESGTKMIFFFKEIVTRFKTRGLKL